jgi:hypothetical protein
MGSRTYTEKSVWCGEEERQREREESEMKMEKITGNMLVRSGRLLRDYEKLIFKTREKESGWNDKENVLYLNGSGD